MPQNPSSPIPTLPTSSTPTLPTSSTPISSTKPPLYPRPPTLTSRFKPQISPLRPWKLFFSLSSFTLPSSYSTSMSRLRRNANYFRLNYALLTLIILFCTLIYHPLSIIIFLAIFILWLFLVFYRDNPVVVFGRIVDDRVVMACLGLVTVIALVFTGLGSIVFGGLVVAVVVVGLHGVLRGVDDLFLDEDEAVEGGLVSVVGGR